MMPSFDLKPLCSVCVANYNGVHYLEKCLDSILMQKDFPGNVEIIVHDDASTDDSLGLLQNKYSRIKLLRSDVNLGFCESNNRMVAVAKGTFILLLNNDAVLHEDALKTLYDTSLKYGDGVFGLPQYDAETEELIDIGSTFDLFLNPIPNTDRKIQNVGMIIGACLWLPKTLWNEIGGFPVWFGSLAEDMYLCCVARLWGYPVKAIPASGFDHWVGRSFGGGKITIKNKLSTTIVRRALSERNKTFVMLICYPTFLVMLLFPFHLVFLSMEGLLLSIVKRDYSLWKNIYANCFKSVFQYRQKILESRKHVQKERNVSSLVLLPYLFRLPRKLTMLVKYGIPNIRS